VIDGRGQTVLIVEDHPVNARLITLMLENLGFHAEAAGDGAQALAQLRDLPEVSLILMDMRMPVMDGLEATRRIRDGEAGDHVREVPVVAVTANVMEADREACHEVGMNHFLAKPISGREIERLLVKIGIGVQDSGN
jgi:CheY-like chemotaxis protein